MQPLAPCPFCARHVRAGEVTCPFCDERLPLLEAPVLLAPAQRLSRAAMFGFTASLAAAACAQGRLQTAEAPDAESTEAASALGSEAEDAADAAMGGDETSAKLTSDARVAPPAAVQRGPTGDLDPEGRRGTGQDAPYESPPPLRVDAATPPPPSVYHDGLLPVYGGPPPIAIPPRDPPRDRPPFDRGAAAGALGVVNVASCKKPDGPTGSGHVSVTFDTDGTVSSASVDQPPFQGTPVGACVAHKFGGAHIPVFGGGPVKVGKTFVVN
jgi:hypothetical protein